MVGVGEEKGTAGERARVGGQNLAVESVVSMPTQVLGRTTGQMTFNWTKDLE